MSPEAIDAAAQGIITGIGFVIMGLCYRAIKRVFKNEKED